jgi:hypothetical protein
MPRWIFERNICGFALTNSELFRLKLKAIRSGVWFRALRRIDRVLVDLTLRVSDNVHSHTLANALLSVVARLEDALKSRVTRVTEEVGFQLARKASLIAQRFGNAAARNWATSLSLARFLAIMYMNDRGRFKP